MSARVVAILLMAALLFAGCGSKSAVKCSDLIANANGTNTGHTKVEVTTNKGVFKVELFDDASPISAKNFKTYVEEKFYDNVVFHRIIKTFMMQGGKFDNTTKAAKPGAHAPIELEASKSGCLNKAYTLSMARQGGSNPTTATTEFFVNFKDNTNLDPTGPNTGYAVFGIVYEGRDVVDKIKNVPVHVYNAARDPMCQSEQGGAPNCPDSSVEMVSVKLL